MTTAPAPPPGPRASAAVPVVRGPLAGSLLVGVLAAALGGLLDGSSAALGAVLGAVMVVLFFGLGALILGVVARLAPAASLLVAMLTYTLKVVLLGVVFLALTRSGALGELIDARWLGGTVIACTLVWLSLQVVASTRARQPLYDLPAQAPVGGPEASVR